MTTSWNPSTDEEVPAGLGVGRPDFSRRGPRSTAGSDRDGGAAGGEGQQRKGSDVSRMTKEEREAYFAEKQRQKNEAVLAKLGLSLNDLPQSRTKSIPAVSSAKPPMREPREPREFREPREPRARRQSDTAASWSVDAPAAACAAPVADNGWGVTEEPSLGARRPEPVDEAPPGFASVSPPPPAAAAPVASWSIDAVDSQTSMAVSGWDIPAEPMPKAPEVRKEMPKPQPQQQPSSYQAAPAPAADSFGFAVDLVNSQSALAVSGWDVPSDEIPSYSQPAFVPEPVQQKPAPVPVAAPVAPRTAPAPVSAPKAGPAPMPVQAPAPAPVKEKEPAMFGFSVDLVSSESNMAVSGWDVPADDFPRAEPANAAPVYAQPAPAPIPAYPRPAVAPVVQAPRLQPVPAPIPQTRPVVESKAVESYPAVDLVDSQCPQAVSGWDVPADDFPRAAPIPEVKPVMPVAPPQPIQQQKRQPQAPPAPVQQTQQVPRQERPAPPAPAAPVVTIAKEQPSEFDSWSVDLVNSQSNGAVSGWDVPADDFPRVAPSNAAGWDIPKPAAPQAAAPQPVQQKAAPAQVVDNAGWKIDKLPSEQMNERRPQYSYHNDSPASSKASAIPADHVTCPHCHKGFSLSSL